MRLRLVTPPGALLTLLSLHFPPAGRPLPVCHPAHGGVLVHGSPAPLGDGPAAHRPLPLLGYPAVQQSLPPVLPGHQLPLPQRSDHGHRHRGVEPTPENRPQGPDARWGPAGLVRPGDGSSPKVGRQRAHISWSPNSFFPVTHRVPPSTFLSIPQIFDEPPLCTRHSARLVGASQKCIRITWETG